MKQIIITIKNKREREKETSTWKQIKQSTAFDRA